LDKGGVGMYINLERRCRNLLDLLAKYDDFTTIEIVSNQLGQSRRSTQYDIVKLNDVFNQAGLSPIDSRRNKGVRLLIEHKAWWDSFNYKEHGKINYIFTQEERVAFIICESILANKVIKIDEMADKLAVSRNTIFLDMKMVKEKLMDYNISFEYVSKSGYIVQGDGKITRSVFMYFLSYLYPLILDGILPHLRDEEIIDIKDRLTHIERELEVHYSPSTIDKIAIMIKCCDSNIPFLMDAKEEGIFEKKAYHLVNKYFPEKKREDQAYITIQLLGARLRDGSSISNDKLPYYKEKAEILVDNFQRLIGIEIENKDLLVYNLAKHLNVSIYRYMYGLLDVCDIEEIQNDTKEIFDLVNISAKELSKAIGYPINESEVAYLTLHVSAHMRRNNIDIGKIKILLVVKELGEGEKLKEKMNARLPMFQVIDIIHPPQLPDYEGEYSVVISTQLLKYNGFYAYISNQLNNSDEKKVLEVYLRYRMISNQDLSEDLYTSIQKYIPKAYKATVKEEISKYFLKPIPNILQLLEEKNVQCIESISDWRDALAQASYPLLENGSITSSYIDSMITNVELYGCYTYFGNGVYLAHAQSNHNVCKSGVSVLTIKKAVRFSEEHFVKLLIVIASTDKNEHFSVLKETVRLCNEEKKVNRMLASKDEKALYQTIKSIVEEENDEGKIRKVNFR